MPKPLDSFESNWRWPTPDVRYTDEPLTAAQMRAAREDDDVDDLVTWLREQLDLDRRHAEKDLWILDHATDGGSWRAFIGSGVAFSDIKADGSLVVRVETEGHEADAAAIARFVKMGRRRAEQALAEVEAKRARIDLLAGAWAAGGHYDAEVSRVVSERLLKLEAQPYASRPGFRDEWRLT